MMKFGITLVVLAQVIGLSCGLLSNLIGQIVDITSDFQAIEIKGVGGVGYIAIPFNLICRVPIVGDCIFCGLCNQDCIYAHNAFGGKCGPDPLKPGNFTCLCYDDEIEADVEGVSISTRETCGCELIPDDYLNLQDAIFKPVIKIRAKTLQCALSFPWPITTSACRTDCAANHGVDNAGTCVINSPKAPGSGILPDLYCEC